MDDGVIIFIPYGSRLGFHVGGPASTMANIDYKFPQCVCYEVQMDERLIVLNDQGGAVMDVSYEKAATLRAQDHGHAPVICFEPGIMSRDCSAGNRAYENLCSTLRANMGDNQPAVCYAIEGNVVDRISAKNGKGWCEDVSPTLNTQDKHAVCYEVQMDVIAIEGNGARPSHQGTGYSDEGKMFTLNTIEKHAVCYDARGNGDGLVCPTMTGDHENMITDYTAILCYNDRRRADYHIENYPIRTMSHDLFSTRFGEDGKANTLARTDYKEPPIVAWEMENNQMGKKYVLRRLTPMECARLQGFPDWWTDGVEGSDSNQYKMWGNGIALPCAADVIGRIAKEMENNGLQGH